MGIPARTASAAGDMSRSKVTQADHQPSAR